MNPLMMEELAAERSRALQEQAHRARLGARVAGSGSRPISRRVGLWFVSAGLRLAGRPGDRVIVELTGGGVNGRRTFRYDGRPGRVRG